MDAEMKWSLIGTGVGFIIAVAVALYLTWACHLDDAVSGFVGILSGASFVTIGSVLGQEHGHRKARRLRRQHWDAISKSEAQYWDDRVARKRNN